MTPENGGKPLEPGRRAVWNPGIEFVRTLALFAAVLPHFSPPPPQWGDYPFYVSFIDTIASLGVPLFFIISGYLFLPSLARPFRRMIRRRYLVPWLVASLVFFFGGAVAGKNPFSLARFFGIAVGYYSIYYFLALLLLFEVMTWLVARAGLRPGYLFPAAFLLGLASVSWTASLLLKASTGVFEVSRFFTYLNPFSFYVYYALGLLLADPRVEACLARRRSFVFVAALTATGAKFAETYFLFRAGRYSLIYFSPLSLLLGVLVGTSLILRFVYSGSCAGTYLEILRIGKYVLPIYLYHLAATAILAVLFDRIGIPMVPYHLVGVFLAVWLTYRFIRFGEKMLPPRLAEAVFGLSRGTGVAPEGLNG